MDIFVYIFQLGMTEFCDFIKNSLSEDFSRTKLHKKDLKIYIYCDFEVKFLVLC